MERGILDVVVHDAVARVPEDRHPGVARFVPGPGMADVMPDLDAS